MRYIISFIFLAGITVFTGCGTIEHSGLFSPNTHKVVVFNNVSHVDGRAVDHIKVGKSASSNQMWVRLNLGQRGVISISDHGTIYKEVLLTAQGYDQFGNPLGLRHREFSFGRRGYGSWGYSSAGTEEKVWEIGSLRSPSSGSRRSPLVRPPRTGY